MLAVICTVRFALGFQFQSAGSVTPFVLEAFGGGYAGLGTLVGLYLLPGILLTIPFGFIGQGFGDKAVVLAGLALMVLGGLLSGTADSYAALAAGRLIAGVGAIVQLVLLHKMVADWFEGRELFFAISIFIVGWPVGIAAGQIVQPGMAGVLGWQAVFLVSSALCLVGVVMVAALYRSPGGASGGGAARGRLQMLDRREMALVSIAGLAWMGMNGSFMIMLSFGPVLLRDMGLSFEDAARTVSVLAWVCIFAVPLGGYLAMRFDLPRTLLIVGLGGTALCYAALPFWGWTVVLLTIAGILASVAAPVIAAFPPQVLRAETRAPGLGLFMVWNFIGMALLPVVAGYAADATGTAEASVLLAAGAMAFSLAASLAFYPAAAALAPRGAAKGAG